MTKQEIKVVFNEVLIEQALAPIPNQGVSLWNEKQVKVLKRLLKEARSRSEMPELLTTAFNTKLLDGYKEHSVVWPQIFDYLTITKKDVDLPGLKGIHVFEISSGEEKKFIGPCPGEATLTPKKYVSMIPFTEEMLDDCEINLMGWTLRMVGHRQKQKEDEIAFGAVTTRGVSMNANTSTGLNAGAIEAGLAILMNRTVTCQSYAEQDPIAADFLLVDPNIKVSLKAGFGENSILGQEVANFAWRIRIGESLSLSLECKIGYSTAQKRAVLG